MAAYIQIREYAVVNCGSMLSDTPQKEIIPQMEQYGIYVPGPIGALFRKVREWKLLAVEVVRDCREREIKTPFLKPVMEGEKDAFLGRELTDGELAEECMGGMFGGSGTTANTFVYILWACLRKPEVVRRLKEELREATSNPREVLDYATSSKLSYLQAVINETLRLYPTIIATLPRTARESTTITGVHIPKGVTVGTQNCTLHRDPKAFPEPEEFRPERWLNIDKDSEAAMHEAWNPFSIGSRRCIGVNLAQMELSKLVASFFLRFDAMVDSSMKVEDMRMYDTFNAGPAGAKLLISMRESAA